MTEITKKNIFYNKGCLTAYLRAENSINKVCHYQLWHTFQIFFVMEHFAFSYGTLHLVMAHFEFLENRCQMLGGFWCNDAAKKKQLCHNLVMAQQNSAETMLRVLELSLWEFTITRVRDVSLWTARSWQCSCSTL